MPVPVYPQFPEDIPTCPLLAIDYQLVKSNDGGEINKLWAAATELGFWYLKNHELDEEVNDMMAVGDKTLHLPHDVKLQYEQGDSGASFGYKTLGATVIDVNGNLDTLEFLNISKDDALAFPKQVHRGYPAPITEQMVSTVAPFVRKADEITSNILRVFNDRLELPPNFLTDKLHSSTEYSSSEVRWTRNPAGNKAGGLAMGAHTDFGSLNLLFNGLGGLQVLPVGMEEWRYVKPLPGHAVCNIGDALAFFSGGILRSGVHRVVGAPGAQAGLERISLIYFSRPGDSVPMKALTNDSAMVAEAVLASKKDFDSGFTAYEWFTKRIRAYRAKNRKGPETWIANRGTEHVR